VIRRLFWLAMGVTIGVLVVRKLSKAAERMSPSSVAHDLAAGVGDLAASMRAFGTEVRSAMREREIVLRQDVGLDGELGRQDRI
jgi:hypothetical protein